MSNPTLSPSRSPARTALTLGLCAFLGVAAYFLWTEHRAHLQGALPWLLLLACPIIHMLMHRRHAGHDPDGAGRDRGEGHEHCAEGRR